MIELSQFRGEFRQWLSRIPYPSTARHIHTGVSGVFTWAIENELYGLGSTTVNPCHGIKPKSYGFIKNYNTRPVSDAVLRALWPAADKAGYPWGYFLKFVVLAVGRNGESVLARWSEIDFDKKIWTIPKEHSKNRREVIKPLSDAAIALLASMPRDVNSALDKLTIKKGHDWTLSAKRGRFRLHYDPTRIFGVYPMKMAYGGQSSRTTPQNTINRYMPDDLRDWGFHRLRHTFKTCMAEHGRLVDPVAVEFYLSHGHKNEMEKHYNMHSYMNEMREAAELWAREVARKINPPEPNVIPFQKKTA
jgi:integrase